MTEMTYETGFKVLKEIREKYQEESWWRSADLMYLKDLGFHILVSIKNSSPDVIDLPLYQQGVLIIISDDMMFHPNSFDV